MQRIFVVNAKNAVAGEPAGAKGARPATEEAPKRVAVMLDVVNYYELLHAKNKYPVRLSFNQFVKIALPRCPHCGSLIIQTPNRLLCTRCGAKYKLERVES